LLPWPRMQPLSMQPRRAQQFHNVVVIQSLPMLHMPPCSSSFPPAIFPSQHVPSTPAGTPPPARRRLLLRSHQCSPRRWEVTSPTYASSS
jgi:hypothetical protein